jgi:hypothetical protein
VKRQAHFFQPLRPFLELAGTGFFAVTALAFFAMSTVELESCTASAILRQLARWNWFSAVTD